jgi:hypothetical protein
MKFRKMPVPLHAGLVDDYVGPILEDTEMGEFERRLHM